MPSTSKAQSRAMFAAAAGHSTLGIPKKVGAEFSTADKAKGKGGLAKLPKKKRKWTPKSLKGWND